ncbi:hypothetical protein Ddc_15592 [Ditylenchus destructor]|nr:hypothetical protein Ddc_15592 [Ditylenchus destructor]
MMNRRCIFILMTLFILQLVPLYVCPPPGTNDDPRTQEQPQEGEAQNPEEGGTEEPKHDRICDEDSQETEPEQRHESFSNPPHQNTELKI